MTSPRSSSTNYATIPPHLGFNYGKNIKRIICGQPADMNAMTRSRFARVRILDFLENEKSALICAPSTAFLARLFRK